MEGKKDKKIADNFASFWKNIYVRYFIDFKAMSCPIKDSKLLEKGVNRVVYMKSNKVICTTEIVSQKNDKNILLQYWSDYGRKVLGWIESELIVNFIAFGFVESNNCYLFGWQALKKAWRENKKDWMNKYETVKINRQKGRKIYTSYYLSIPPQDLILMVSSELLVSIKTVRK